jgi:TRAP-type C4-dicarboxylate transport system permease small subunit
MCFLHRLDRALAWLERASVVLFLVSLLLLGLAQVILRNVFASGLFWADDILRHLVLWIGFLGASLVTREQRHLRMDVLTHWLPWRYQAWLNLLTSLLAMAACALLAHAAWTYVVYEHMAGTKLSVGLPIWVAQSILPVGFACMALRFAFRALMQLGQLQKDPM